MRNLLRHRRSEHSGQVAGAHVTAVFAAPVFVIGVVSVVVLGMRILGAGYGADNDTFLMLGTWDILSSEGRYLPSRYQGNPLAELVIGAASSIGGHWLSGLVSLSLGAACLRFTYLLVLRRTGDRINAALLTAVLATTPVFIIAATTSVDYLYGLAPFLAGWYLFERGRPPEIVGLFFGLATAGRVTYLAVGLLVVVLDPLRHVSLPRRLMGAMVTLTVSVLAYVPALVHADWDLSIFGADRPTGQGLTGLFGRAVVKGSFMMGLLGSLLAVVAFVVGFGYRRRSCTAGRKAGPVPGRAIDDESRGQTWLAIPLAVVVALWVWLPVEPSYLLPGMVLGILWASSSRVMDSLRPLLLAIIAALTMYGWVDVQLFRISYVSQYGIDDCRATEAKSADFAFSIEQGPLLRYPSEVRDNRPCNELIRERHASRSS